MNRAILIGRLGRDPEVRTFQNGGRVVAFALATSERWKDKAGEKQERTEWHNIQIFNEGLGKVAEQYLRKGSQCMIEGQIQTREFKDKDGNQRKATEIVVPRFGGSLELLGGKDSDAKASKSSGGGGSSGGLDDEVPF